ncbi:replicative DNA helicase [Paenibacillus sp. HJL G12]|uniref:Replicative DNA helicase n=1 Tax=Paenibacillus dendrobii TaxID=2691084 RepID=A0A7X3LI31_9BACL|nr:replicative DNA helicase [Paenibacillus dendrobii]MWV44840.1 replicative DNA helicase [Paenibacillus dendrobii]
MTEWKEKLSREVVAAEGYLTGLFWRNPDNYNFYPEEKINYKSFLNPVYGFYFSLGRKLSEKGIKVFDDISVSQVVNETNTGNAYGKYGGYQTMNELSSEVKDKDENLDAYYSEIKKYNLIVGLIGYLGERVITNEGKYNYKKMSKEQLHTYWNDKILQLGIDGDNKYDEHYLLEGLDDEINDWDENPTVGLPFYESKRMTKITTGWDYGHVYMYGGFGGSGKTSFTVNKVIMSCIANKEKLLVIANEQSIGEFKKMLMITAMGVGTKEYVDRQKLNEGGFSDQDKAKLHKAKQWIYDLCEGNEKLITFVFMENYIMEDVKKLVKHYAARGIKRMIIDTGKPSEGDASMARWERFVEDMKEVYKLARPNGGGLNLAVWVNVQLADTALKMRFLNEYALGDGKKIKNEASVLILGRFMWDDEYEGGKHELLVNQWDDFTGDYIDKPMKREKGHQYYLLFYSKNRRGADNKTGQKVLVLKPYFGINTWYEVGFTTVYDDHNY